MRYEELPFVGEGGSLHINRWIDILGPHSLTERVSISSGADEILVIRYVYISINRVSAPTTYWRAFISCRINYGGEYHILHMVSALPGEFPVFRYAYEQLNFPLIRGSSFTVVTYDGSVGGSVEYSSSVLLERFVV